MRTLVLSVFIVFTCAVAGAQQRQSTTYVLDLNGNRVDWAQSRAGDGRSSETIRSLNGRNVPIEQVEEKVIRNEGGVRVVERLAKRYDPNGAPLPPVKTVIETTTRPDGSSSEKLTVYQGDLNGNLRPYERTTVESNKAGDTTTSQTTRETTSINGGFDAVERRATRTTATKTSSESDEMVYLRNANGDFTQAARVVTRSQIADGETRQQVDEYESATSMSGLKLFRQSIGRTVIAADGSERKEVDVFGPAAPGRPVADDRKLQLRERQIYSSRQSADGTTVQVFSIQRPKLTSTEDLGPVQKISETVTRETKK